MARRKNGNGNGNGKRLATQQSVDQAVKSICDIMRRGNCAGAMQYVPELTWILFLRILDEKEDREEQEAEALGVPFRPSLRGALPLARLGRAAGDPARGRRPTSAWNSRTRRRTPFSPSSTPTCCRT